MKICIIGGGLTGLTSAYALSGRHDIDILEKTSTPGGCLSSYQVGQYWIEKYYHHCFSGDHALISLFDKLGLSGNLEWRSGTTGYFAGGTIYPLTTPSEILRYPELGLADKARLALLTMRAKKMDTLPLDSVTAEDFIVRHIGKRVYTSFFEPLLRSKFGERRSEVSAAWLVSRIKIRSDRGIAGERLGYLNGGFHLLVDSLVSAISTRGTRIRYNTPATSLVKAGNSWSVNGENYDAVISTIPPGQLQRIGGPELPEIPYQGAACMTIGLDRDVTDNIYWLNMKDQAPYGAVVSHTNFIPPERYGEHILYLASYFSGTVTPGLDKVMIGDFCRRFSVPDEAVHWHKLAVDPFAGPVYTTGFHRLIPSYGETGLYMAGMFSAPNYPERSMEGSVQAGFGVAGVIDQEAGE
ncbi:MAG: NAD(P)/FAD-dependent oxidoreductase [Methanoregulaceae archaeon]|jgi:protoporphyrinogen oxidase|nr:NAD(P)/FAD-dependent oxidoreductase [Methanoregulaceae archaeon]